MLYHRNTLIDLNPKNMKVLVRVDFNVPYSLNPTNLLSDLKILSTIPTIKYLLKNDCSIIVCSHFGRPNGKYVADFDLKPITERFSELLGMNVEQLDRFDFDLVTHYVDQLKPQQVLMLPNLRFHPGEETNSTEFARFLGSLADLFVNDAFGVSHRLHASTVGVTKFLPSIAGLLMAKEVDVLRKLIDAPQTPFVVIMGGAKVSDKIQVIDNISKKADCLMIGGSMAATFLKAKGYEIGNSLIDRDSLSIVENFCSALNSMKCKLLLPVDVKVEMPLEYENVKIVASKSIPREGRVMDIGPKSVETFSTCLRKAKTILWNGPMGVYERKEFRDGTISIAKAISSLSKCTSTLVGGGSTAEIVEKLELIETLTHVSTGGGASLDFLGGKPMPAIEALYNNITI